MPRAPLRVRWLSFAVLMAAAPAQRAIDVPPGAPWALRTWDATSGLPQNTVNAMLQSRCGALWAATYGGLCRFDGAHWTVFDTATVPAFRDTRIVALAQTADGALWFGTELGIVMRHDANGFAVVATVGDGTVRYLVPLPDDAVACGGVRDVHVVRIDGTVRPLRARPLPDTRTLLVAADGEVLAGGGGGLVRDHDGQRATLHTMPVASLARGADGTVWVAGAGGLFRLGGDRAAAVPHALPAAVAGQHGAVVHVGEGGTLWYATATTLCCVPDPDGGDGGGGGAGGGGTAFPLDAPPICLTGDTQGGTWVGFAGGGLARLSRGEAVGVPLRHDDGRALGANSVLAVADQRFLVGTSQGLFTVDGGAVTRDPRVPATGVYALHRDDDGTTWIGHEHALGRLRDGAYERIEVPPSVEVVRAMHRDRGGRLLLGTSDGVWVAGERGERAEPFLPAAPLRGAAVKLFVPWPDGGTWIAGERSLLRLSRDGEQQAVLRRGVDLPLAEVRAVLPGAGDRAWLATYGAAFVAVDGTRTRVVGPRDGVPEAYLCSVVPFAGRWLVGGNRGPFFVDPAALDRVADGVEPAVPFRALVCAGGVPREANGGVQPSSSARGGVAALASVGGLLLVRDAATHRGLPPPICAVDVQLAGDQRREGGAEPAVAMHATRTVNVACSAPDFEFPEALAYRWRLDGGPWTDRVAGASIAIAVDAPGEHVAEFVAVASDGTTSLVPARLRLAVAPFVWERAWFPWAVTAALLLAGVAAFRVGSWRSARHAERLRGLVHARTAALLHARDELEHRVAQRTRELQHALARLEQDHEQRLRLERELEQMRRMESLGQLAGSVAHDFNNLLTVVFGNAELLDTQDDASPDVRAAGQRILEAAARGREMTQRLLAVASRQTTVPRVFDLGDALRAELSVVRGLMGPSVRVELHVTDEPLRLRAGRGQIDQIVTNLAVNARDALRDGGTFTIRAGGEPGPHGRIQLVIADDGAGMPAAVAQRAFEPFFTTRGGQGTGLGLATVYGITKQLQGDVVLDTMPGHGTRFTFTFPRAAADDGVRGETPPTVPAATGGTAGVWRVLLIEDERDVRHAVRLLLEACGCIVVAEAHCGDDALRALADAALAVDLAVSDVRMPGLQGTDLVYALRAVRPGLPILFLSGHTSSASLAADLGPLGIELLTKPPTAAELAAALARALHGRRSAGGVR